MQTTNGARQALITRQNLEDIALKGRDFAGMLKMLPGVVDTSARDAPGWESMNGLTINGQANFNFSYDGVTNKDTGSNSGELRRAGPRLDRGSPGADLELPGRVRPQLRCDDHRRHPQRHARTSAAAPRSTSATTR